MSVNNWSLSSSSDDSSDDNSDNFSSRLRKDTSFYNQFKQGYYGSDWPEHLGSTGTQQSHNAQNGSHANASSVGPTVLNGASISFAPPVADEVLVFDPKTKLYRQMRVVLPNQIRSNDNSIEVSCFHIYKLICQTYQWIISNSH